MALSNNFQERLGLTFTDIKCTQPRIKCYVLSDLHADAVQNQIWLRENCRRLEEDRDVFTVFIVPGDIGTQIARLQDVFNLLVANFDAVVYCPGNHEAWCSGGNLCPPEEKAADSIEKIVKVVASAKACGIHVGPLRIERPAKAQAELAAQADEESRSGESSAVTIFPLYSWYHSGWDKETDIQDDMYQAYEKAMPFHSRWGDFSNCAWPEELLGHEHDTWCGWLARYYFCWSQYLCFCTSKASNLTRPLLQRQQASCRGLRGNKRAVSLASIR